MCVMRIFGVYDNNGDDTDDNDDDDPSVYICVNIFVICEPHESDIIEFH